jgi:small subunit ribosomal protein S2
MLTNFSTIRKSIKKMQTIENMLSDKNFESINKKERLSLDRERQKLDRVLGGIEGLNRMPAAIYIVDINKESIALAEALKLNISTFALVDTNTDPTVIDFPIPANDDANKSIALLTEYLVSAVAEGLEERAKDKKAKDAEAAAEGEGADAGEEPKKERKKTVKVASVKADDEKKVEDETAEKPDEAKATEGDDKKTKAKAE